ncbi:amino acid permease, putative [Leishmania tarentolae]|uniref:Amino acid permease, putative n=1 Tax=Leishmania tarentolae TaxID=5689 RepID=A0A640K849_LEITA|nr:amino acid permease, putative [Leishmania tarentolae]
MSSQFHTILGFAAAVSDLLVPFCVSQRASGVPLYRGVVGDSVRLVGMLPRCLHAPCGVASLRYFTSVAATLVIFVVLAVFAHASMTLLLPPMHRRKQFATAIDAGNGLSPLIFGFRGHAVRFRLLGEMRHASTLLVLLDGLWQRRSQRRTAFCSGFFNSTELGLDMSGPI